MYYHVQHGTILRFKLAYALEKVTTIDVKTRMKYCKGHVLNIVYIMYVGMQLIIIIIIIRQLVSRHNVNNNGQILSTKEESQARTGHVNQFRKYC